MQNYCAINKNWKFTVHLLVPFISNLRDARSYNPKKHNLLKSVFPKREKLLEAVEAVQLFNPEIVSDFKQNKNETTNFKSFMQIRLRFWSSGMAKPVRALDQLQIANVPTKGTICINRAPINLQCKESHTSVAIYGTSDLIIHTHTYLHRFKLIDNTMCPCSGGGGSDIRTLNI